MTKPQIRFFSYSDMIEEAEREAAFQRSLRPNDPRHANMFELSDCKRAVTIYWGGHPYDYELDRLSRPEDVLWLIVHLSAKGWNHMTAQRVANFISKIAAVKGWEPYGKVPHPNEAPKPNFDKIGEREKMTSALRYSVIRRDGYRCRACGFSVQDGAHLHVDHIVPIAQQGRTELANLQTLCTACNIGKGYQ